MATNTRTGTRYSLTLQGDLRSRRDTTAAPGRDRLSHKAVAALSNVYCSFPCGMQRKHADFIVVVAGNTYGKGADALYVGRQQLDAATLNRFAILEWGYDEQFEPELAGGDQLRWTEHVQKVRRAVERLKLRVVVSPRQSIMGATMLRAGFERAEVECIGATLLQT